MTPDGSEWHRVARQAPAAARGQAGDSLGHRTLRETGADAERGSVTQVLLTTDVELWSEGWDLSPRAMTRAYRRYITGTTSRGAVGLPFQLAMLREHGLKGVFFIEPLFASVMGRDALADIVGMVRDAGQESALHLHPEWLGRAELAELPGPPRMSVKELDEDAQRRVIGVGREWLVAAGAEPVTAFRAGAYGADRATLRALAALGIGTDSSHNLAGSRGPLDPALDDTPQEIEGVLEIPQTVYRDALGRLRHAQLGSSSSGELRSAMHQARHQGRSTFVILSHSAELLTGDRERPDRVAVRRFERLCRHLADNPQQFPTANFADLDRSGLARPVPHATLRAGPWATASRYTEQAYRRLL